VIKRACCRIGLPHHSAHALRHTLACRLVENGSSLKEVADLLRHRSLNTTLIYYRQKVFMHSSQGKGFVGKASALVFCT
jgi:integrase